jgi:ABC-type transport system involved in multi-copper enzyme maturation permease subunit
MSSREPPPAPLRRRSTAERLGLAPARAPRRAWRALAWPARALRRALGNLGWPILLKEIRADFRKNRFFFTHLVCLAAMAAGILWRVAVQADDPNARPEQIGQSIFNVFFAIQYLVVLVVFPAFSANSFSEERAGGTFDLLITSDLRPAEIVWGKFLASSGYCLIYIVATVPLLSISLLFAGVTLTEIVLAYLILIGLTVFLAMVGVFISSCFSSPLRATLVMYMVSFAVLGWSLTQMRELLDAKGTVVEAILKQVGARAEGGGAAGPGPGLGLAGLYALGFSYLFLFTTNRILPRAEDRTSKLRLLTLAALGGFLAWGLAGLAGAARGPRVEESFEGLLLWTFTLLMAINLFFSAEPADVPLRLRRQFGRWRGVLYPLRLFAPGPFWGLLYGLVLGGAASAALGGVWFGLLSDGGPGDRKFAQLLLTVPLYLWAFGALGFLLSAMDFTPAYTMLTAAFIFIITLLLPVIFQIGGRGDGLLSFYYLSPATLWMSLNPNPHSPEGPRYVLFGRPIIEVARWLFGALGALLTGLGLRRCRRRGYPLLRFR